MQAWIRKSGLLEEGIPAGKGILGAVVLLGGLAGLALFFAPRALQDAGAPGRDPASVNPAGVGGRGAPGESARGPAIVPVDPRVGTLLEFSDYLESQGITGRHAAPVSPEKSSESH